MKGMMKKLPIMIIMMAAVMVLSGCAGGAAGKAYVSNPQWSLARNVVNAAGIGDIKDVEIDKVQASGKGIGQKTVSTTENVGMAALHVLGSTNPLGLASIPMDLIAYPSFFNKEDERRLNQILAWMPKDMAASGEDAMDKVEAMIQGAVMKVLTKNGYSYHDRLKLNFIQGGECSPNRRSPSACYFGVYRPEWVLPFHMGKASAATAGKAPSFVDKSGSDVWQFSKYKTSLGMSVRGPVAQQRFLEQVSALLPGWVYLYISPLAEVHNSTDGGIVNKGVPRVYNKGETHYFTVVKR